MTEHILSMIGLAKKAGQVEIGEEPVGSAARAKDARVILVAKDAAAGSVRRAMSFGQTGACLCLTVPFDKDQLGRAKGLYLQPPGRRAEQAQHEKNLRRGKKKPPRFKRPLRPKRRRSRKSPPAVPGGPGSVPRGNGPVSRAPARCIRARGPRKKASKESNHKDGGGSIWVA